MAERMLRLAQPGAPATDEEQRTLGELELDIAAREQRIAVRVEATAALGERLPLDRVRAAFQLSETETRVLAVLAALETRPLLPEQRAFATIGLIESLVYRRAAQRAESAVELTDDGRLFAHQLAELGPRDLPWLARSIRLSRRVLELALGRVRLDPETARVATLVEHPDAGEHLIIDSAMRARTIAMFRRGDPAIPMFTGPTGSGRRTLALGIAHELGLPALVLRARHLPRTAPELAAALANAKREAILFGALLVVCDLEPLTGDLERGVPDLVPVVADVLARHGEPIILTAASSVWPPAAARPTVEVAFRVPTETEREVLWTRALGSPALAADAARRYRTTGGMIEGAAVAARSAATVAGRGLELDDVRAGIRSQLDGELALLGRRIEWQQTWADLVLPDDVRDELVELVGRVRHRRTVLEDWGFARKVAKGVGLAALFSGPPGTGKTMVAGLVARELQLDLYQIDVSRMVSKYIGETEKNLGRLFDAAATGHAILLFDEADSLFAKRTDVKSSNDRYANLEVNYLLQRLESYEGITILTTNLESSVDEAFKRRLAFRIKFPMPERRERMELWRAMLPEEAKVAPGLDFMTLADRFEMSGGYIRNAVLRAAYLAAADETQIEMHHLQRAAVAEYAAMGKIIHSSL
jgi:AAA+ superfamily predicted ATPase